MVNNTLKSKSILAGIMLIATLVAYQLKPELRLADTMSPVILEQMLPVQFGQWQQLPINESQIVNPEVNEIINKIYQQVISKAYIDPHNRVILVSVAYGENQMSDNSLHRPEICYPAQGFKLKESPRPDAIEVHRKLVRVKRLVAEKTSRVEPITYWTMIGNKNVRGVFENKLEISKYAFKGFIADGLIFRVSMISDNTNDAFNAQDEFIKSLLKSLPAQYANRIAGI